MTTDLLAALHKVIGTPAWTHPHEWDGGPEGESPDWFVSESDATHRQRQVDDELMERWSR